jgi:hypothetical protein
MNRIAVASAALIAALAFPGVALAHVGKSAPVATNFTARITKPLPDVRARVVDGDQVLWLDARSHLIVVAGVEAEPLLRFDRHGVSVNLHSLTAETDRIDRLDLQPATDPRTPPKWHQLTSGHAYGWHEHRLHALEALASNASHPTRLGSWTVPLLIDGRRRALRGVLDYSPPPPWWQWTAATTLLALLASAAALKWQKSLIPIALATVVIVWALRIAREALGRPTINWEAWLTISLSSLVGVLLVLGLRHIDQGIRVFTALLAGFGATYQALTMLPVLTHAIALTLVPTSVARIGVALAFILGAASLIGSLAYLAHDPQERVPAGALEPSSPLQ